MKLVCYLLFASALQILPTFGQESNVLIRLSHSTDKTYYILPPDYNRATIGVLTQNVTLQTNNITGIWQRPDITNTTNNKIEFPPFTANFAGLYRFYITNQDGSYVLAIQIIIYVSGTNFAQVSTQGDYTTLSGNNIFYTTTSLVCATNDTSQEIQWTHQSNLDASTTTVSTSTWNNVTGISTLEIVMTAHGYYTCTPVPGGTSYRVGIFNRDITLVAQQGGTYVYTKGTDPSDILFLCVSTDTNIALNEVIWNLTPFNQNPINLNSLANMDSTLICNLGGSSTLEVTLLVQGPPTISLSNTTQGTFSARPQASNTANIRVLTDNVILQTELEGRWETPGNVSTTDKFIPFPYFTVDHAGLYRFYVTGWDSNEVLAIQIVISVTGSNFAEETSPGVYNILSGNNVFFTAKKLVCATNDTSQQVKWFYRRTQDLDSIDLSGLANWNSTSGLSKLDITTSENGYFTCEIQTGSSSFSAALFEKDITIVATNQISIVYTKSTDPNNIQLLCTTTDSSISLYNIRWNVTTSNNNNENPIILNSLSNNEYILNCNGGTTSLSFNVNLLIQGPPTITLSNTTQGTFSALQPNSNTAAIRVLTQNVTLQINLIGMWQTPKSSSISDNSISYSIFTADLAGLYTFYVNNWKGIQEISISITISAAGSNFAEKLSSEDYRMLSGNNIFYTDRTLVCVTSDTSQEIQWTYQPTQDSTNIARTDATWDTVTGISELSITITEQGYYTCEILPGGTNYTVAIFNPDITIVAAGLFFSYIKGIDPTNIQLLCDPYDTTVTLSSIKLEYSGSQFDNPLILNEAGSIDGFVYCEFGSSQLTFGLIIREPSLKLTYTEYTMQYNVLSPSTTLITIPLFSTDVIFYINNITSGTWNLPRSISGGRSLETPIFTLVSTGRYTFNSTQTWDGVEREVFRIDISLTGDALAIIDSVGGYEPKTNNPFFYTDTALVCLTDYNTEVKWFYRTRSQANKQDITTPTTDVNGISTYSAVISQPGFYICEGMSYGSAYSYTAGVFNATDTRVAEEGASYFYTIGVDREESELLCDLMDSSVNLNAVEWFRKDVHTNPLDLNENMHRIALGAGEIKCFVSALTDIRLTANLTFQARPAIKVDYLEETTSFILYQSVPIYIPLLINNTVISTNLINGIWRFKYSDGNTDSGSNTEYKVDLFTVNNIGVYRYIFKNFYGGGEILVVTLEGTGSGFGMESGSKITTVSNNTIFYQNTLTLVAASNKIQLEPNDIIWTQQNAINDSDISNISEAIIDTKLSISKLNLDTLPNGYYTVSITDNNSTTEQYVVGVFKTENIFDTRVVKTIDYTVGEDSTDLQILCIPQSISVVANIRWRIGANVFFPNPVRLEQISLEFDTVYNAILTCIDITDYGIVFERIQINISRPVSITVSYLDIELVVTANNKIIEIEVFTRNIQLECNRDICIWYNVDNLGIYTVVGNSITYTIQYITIENNKQYVLSTQDNSGLFVPAASIRIRPIGTSFQKLTKNGSKEMYETLSTNSIIMIEESISLVCVTSYADASEQGIEWYYQENGFSNVVLIKGEFNETMGLSVLNANKPGIYLCRVSDQSQRKLNYSIQIVEHSKYTIEMSLSDLQTSQNFVVGQNLVLFFQNVNISVQAIRWGIGAVSADSTSFLKEYLNPVNINKVFNDFGSGAYELSCFYRESPITIVGSLALNLRDNTSLIVQYEKVTTTFNDVGNSYFPEPETISIPITTRNVKISCSLSSCLGIIEKNGESNVSLSIVSLRIEYEGEYWLRRTTDTGFEYTTASFYLIVTGYVEQSITALNFSSINDTSIHIFWELQNQLPSNAQETFNITFQPSNGSIIRAGVTTNLSHTITGLTGGYTYTIWVELSYGYTFNTSQRSIQLTLPKESIEGSLSILVYVIVVIVVIVLLVIIFILLVLCCSVSLKLRMKRQSFQTIQTDKSTDQSGHTLRYNPLAIDNPVFNPEIIHTTDTSNIKKSSSHNYMTIDEASIVPLETERDVIIEEKDPYYSNLARKPIKTGQQEQIKRTKTKEYVLLGENIPYKEYTPMHSMQNEPKFLTKAIPGKEFPATYKQYVESGMGQESCFKKEFELLHESLKQNLLSSSQTNQTPFDENRVVLNSPCIDSDNINASWMENYQFIATIHPTRDTLKHFLQMIYQTEASMVIMLTTRKEKAKIISGISSRVCYWPKEVDEFFNCEPFASSLISYTETTAFVKQEISLKNTLGEKEHSYTHCISSVWNEDSSIVDMSWAIVLLNRIMKQKQYSPNTPIIIHCEDGISKTGILLTLINTMKELNYRNTINIFNTVKNLRKQRMQMVPSLTCYMTCFSLMNEYCSIHL